MCCVLVYLFKTQNNYILVTKGVLEPNLCILLDFYNIEDKHSSVAGHSISISVTEFFSCLL